MTTATAGGSAFTRRQGVSFQPALTDDPSATPCGTEDGLAPSFVQLDALRDLMFLPPIGERLRAFIERSPDRVAETASYLGNVWGTIPEAASS